MKKINLIWIFGILVSLGVRAAPDVPDMIGRILDALIQIFDFLLHGGNNNQVLLSQLLFFVIILAVVFIGMQKVPIFSGKKNTALLVSIAVSLLATRFIHLADARYGENIIEFLLLPYGALGISITVLIPLLIYYYFFKDFDAIFRRIGWGMMSAVFFSFWWIRSDDIGNLGWIYFWGGVLSLAFLAFDGTLQKFLNKSASERAYQSTISRQVSSLNREIDEVTSLIAKENNPIQRQHLRQDLKDLRERIREIEREPRS